MKSSLLSLFALVLCSAAATGAAPAAKKVLFVGNSQMFYYDLPGMIALMADSAPAAASRIEVGRALVGGATLRKHWDAGLAKSSARALLAAERWDFVVIQEHFAGQDPEFSEYALKFDEEIRKAGAKTILFATASVTPSYSAGYVYPASFHALNDLQIDLGKKHDILVAPAGYAWIKYLGATPSEAGILALYDKDKGHPGGQGTYIYACLLYASITGQTPEGLVSDFPKIRGGVTIGKAEATKMQLAAWEQYQESSKR